jgi:hypothetical protein
MFGLASRPIVVRQDQTSFQFPASYERKSLSTTGEGFETTASYKPIFSRPLSLVQSGYAALPLEFSQIPLTVFLEIVLTEGDTLGKPLRTLYFLHD